MADNGTNKVLPERVLGLRLHECSICTEELIFDNFPHRIFADCMHDPTCCHACLSRSIGAQIESKQWDRLTCPECPAFLTFDNVKKSFASEADFIRYDKTHFYPTSAVIPISQIV
ncbi:hypothetical protein SBOR_6651 [Sclerotinia borealis F-4128]|uniref:RING-type domain-containing protein n=1 Tax=Sclerotinia borealis (strain F-4128) TaxID=1432307 RepID=W9CEK9_SCLBF|nr:hypothetical protein SBOR_6651 [Sclerotinia borealis F-4128]